MISCSARQTGKPLRPGNFRGRIGLPAVEKAGLTGARIHDLRHTHVALLITQGEKPLASSKRLGHRDAKVTLTRYRHLMHDEDEALADRMEALAPGAGTPLTAVTALG